MSWMDSASGSSTFHGGGSNASNNGPSNGGMGGGGSNNSGSKTGGLGGGLTTGKVTGKTVSGPSGGMAGPQATYKHNMDPRDPIALARAKKHGSPVAPAVMRPTYPAALGQGRLQMMAHDYAMEAMNNPTQRPYNASTSPGMGAIHPPNESTFNKNVPSNAGTGGGSTAYKTNFARGGAVPGKKSKSTGSKKGK